MTQHDFQLPERSEREGGEERRVGFELEFSGVTLDDAEVALLRSLGGERRAATAAQREIAVPGAGTFTIEIDWQFLKRIAEEQAADSAGSGWLEPLSRAAMLLVPVEVVCPPLPMTALDQLQDLVAALREAGAQGTEESLIAAYGVHINAELPDLEARTIHDYLRAFALLQWWLVERHEVDPARRISPYIDPYPEAYLRAVLAYETPDLDTLFDDYLAHNATRNRALDLLPLLAELDEARVLAKVDDPRIKARPAFHYRLPNCHIEREDWSLAQPWNTWCVVERLAAAPDALDELGETFIGARRPILGVEQSAWKAHMTQWLQDHGWV